jgi:hypothetical protein
MGFKVTSVSRGDIHLTDGTCIIRVLGEGLIPPTKNSASFVVYLNSFYMVEDGEAKKIVDEELKNRAIDSIKSYFQERDMIVDFE